MKYRLECIPLLLVISVHNVYAAAPADEQFTALAEKAMDSSLDWRPLDATGTGLHAYDGRLPDYSKSAIAHGIAEFEKCQSELEQCDSASLSARNRYDRLIILAGLHRDLFWIRTFHRYQRDPMGYVPDLAVYVQQNFAPLADRLKSVIAIENAMPKVFASARENLDEVLARPRVVEAIRNAQGAADFFEKDLVTAFADVHDNELQAAFKATTKIAAAELRNYGDFLKKEKLPKADEHYALGRDLYRQMLAGELVTLSPEEILVLGTKELHAEQKRFEAAAKEIDPSRKPIDVFAAIQHEHPTAEHLIGDTAKNLEAIRQYLIDHDIVTVPSEVRAVVVETPPYLRQAFAMFISPGPLETHSSQAYYYVTPTESNWTAEQKDQWLTSFNFYTTDIVSIHEAYPGHYVHGLHLRAEGVTKPEAVFSSYAFTEGWAHYTEQMMIEQGFGTGGDPIRAAKYRLAQSDEALLRVCRLCVSIRMHCQGMNVDQATQFFRDNCYYEEKPARAEAVRGTNDPEYLYYTLGKLQFLKLRDDFRKQEGSNFSLRKYHDAVLSHGTPPMRLLRQQLLHDAAKWDECF
jgi:uncharacterized protein (DUF885 family)